MTRLEQIIKGVLTGGLHLRTKSSASWKEPSKQQELLIVMITIKIIQRKELQ